MRVVLIYFARRHPEKARTIARALVSELQTKGHQVDMFDIADKRDVSMTKYQYVVVLGETVNNWSSKISSEISGLLSQTPTVKGKRATALLLKPVLWKRRALLNLMKILEAEGMIVNYSELALHASQASSLALTLPLADD